MGRPPWTREEADAAIERTLESYRRYGLGPWLAEDRRTGEPVGRVGLSYHRAWPDDPEVGWWIDPARWGEGLATEAGGASIDHAFATLRVPRVVSITTESNLASRRVMAKLGLRKLTEVALPEIELPLWVHVRDAGDAAG